MPAPTVPQPSAPGPSGPGLFLTLEGGDGSGKSTQSALLTDWLTAQGRKQRYGTHWTNREDAQGNSIPQPLEDPEHVDEIRAGLHLPPLAEEAARVADMNRHVREQQEDYKRKMNG